MDVPGKATFVPGRVTEGIFKLDTFKFGTFKLETFKFGTFRFGIFTGLDVVSEGDTAAADINGL